MLKDRKDSKQTEKPGRTQFIMMFFAFSFGMILSNLLAQSSAQKHEEERPPLFIYQGIDKTLDDISLEYRERLLKLEERKRQTLEIAALQMHLYQYAKDKNLSIEDAGEALFPSSELLIDEARVSEFYRENQDVLAKPYYQVKQEIKTRLESENIARMKQKLLASLEESGDLAILPDM